MRSSKVTFSSPRPKFESPFGIAWALIAKVNVVTRRCFDRPSDSSAIFKSVFLLISAIAVSNALWRKFAQTRRLPLLAIRLPTANASPPRTQKQTVNGLKFTEAKLDELRSYLYANRESVRGYAEAYRNGERISTAHVARRAERDQFALVAFMAAVCALFVHMIH
jgi:hypothetical protein